jgi:hypothetical protein
LSPRTGLSFSAQVFWKKPLYAPRRVGLLTADFSVRRRDARISWCLPEPNDRGALRNPAMLPCSLTVKGDNDSVFVRVFSIARRGP